MISLPVYINLSVDYRGRTYSWSFWFASYKQTTTKKHRAATTLSMHQMCTLYTKMHNAYCAMWYEL